jgi:hypothetical protein
MNVARHRVYVEKHKVTEGVGSGSIESVYEKCFDSVNISSDANQMLTSDIGERILELPTIFFSIVRIRGRAKNLSLRRLTGRSKSD